MLNKKPQQILNIFGIFLTVSVALACAAPLLTGGDFWVDEAMVVQGVLTRDFMGIISRPPDYSQSAPIGYLLILKLFSLISESELMLRLPAYLFACGTIVVIYKIAKNSLNSLSPFFYSGLGCLFTTFITYSAQTKQYTLETLCILIFIYHLDLYFKDKVTPIRLSIVSAIIVWFSFTSIFFVSSLIVVIVSFNILKLVQKQQNMEETIKHLSPFFITVISLLLDVLIWAIPSSGNIQPPEKIYWSKLSFPLIPTSIADIKLFFYMAINIIKGFSKYGVLPIVIGLTFLIRFINRYGTKLLLSKLMITFYVTLVICIIASYLGKMPVISRIWIFIYPLTLILVARLIEDVLTASSGRFYFERIIAVALCFMFIIDFVGLSRRNFKVMPYQQLSLSLKYVNKHIKDGDFIYVDSLALPQYSYLTGYKVKFDYFLDDGLVEQKNIIFGSTYRNNVSKEPYKYINAIIPTMLEENVRAIKKHDTVYLLFAHEVPLYDLKTGIATTVQSQLLDALKKYGKLTLIQSPNQTPLYRFDRKAKT